MFLDDSPMTIRSVAGRTKPPTAKDIWDMRWATTAMSTPNGATVALQLKQV